MGVNVHFPLNVEKAIQAVGVLFRNDRVRRMNYMRVLKLLYIADREALGETGRPIIGGLTHNFAEWKKNDPGASSRPIPLSDTLEAIGQGGAVAEIVEEACEKIRIERLFGR
jgi:hypothetical protein